MKYVLRDFRERKSPILELELEAGIVIPSATAEQEVAAQYSTGTPACIWPCSSTALDSGCLARVSHREPKASCSKVQSWCHNVIRKKKGAGGEGRRQESSDYLAADFLGKRSIEVMFGSAVLCCDLFTGTSRDI